VSDDDAGTDRDELEADRRAERGLIPKGLIALTLVVALVILREWLIR